MLNFVQDRKKKMSALLNFVQDRKRKMSALLNLVQDRRIAFLKRTKISMSCCVVIYFKFGLLSVCSLLEQEKREHDDLKRTWQMANDQFLESQRLMMMDMRRMESLLTAEQQRQVTGW